jgi:hypothetical protein
VAPAASRVTSVALTGMAPPSARVALAPAAVRSGRLMPSALAQSVTTAGYSPTPLLTVALNDPPPPALILAGSAMTSTDHGVRSLATCAITATAPATDLMAARTGAVRVVTMAWRPFFGQADRPVPDTREEPAKGGSKAGA